MVRENPTIRECGHNYPIGVVTLGRAGGGLEDVAPGSRLVESRLT